MAGANHNVVTALERLKTTALEETNDHVKGHYKWLQLLIKFCLFVLLEIYKEEEEGKKSGLQKKRINLTKGRSTQEACYYMLVISPGS